MKLNLLKGEHDMAGRSSKRDVNLAEVLESVLTDIIQPSLNALKETPARAGDNTGPGTQVAGTFKFILGDFAQRLHDQLKGMEGYLPSKDGRSFPALITRYQDSLGQFETLQGRHSGDDEGLTSDPNFHRVTSWLRYNECNVTAVRQIYDAVCGVYAQVVGTSFVPRKMEVRTTAVGAAMVDAAAKAANAKALAELRAKAA
jgi:hypothetical protein